MYTMVGGVAASINEGGREGMALLRVTAAGGMWSQLAVWRVTTGLPRGLPSCMLLPPQFISHSRVHTPRLPHALASAQGVWFGKPAACVMYDLAYYLQMNNTHMLWWEP